jgi:hypothetical protein
MTKESITFKGICEHLEDRIKQLESKVRLLKGEAEVMDKDQIIKDALNSAVWVTCSEHEWKWKHEEQVNMARAVIFLSDRIQKSIEEFNNGDGSDSETLVKVFEILSGNESKKAE